MQGSYNIIDSSELEKATNSQFVAPFLAVSKDVYELDVPKSML